MKNLCDFERMMKITTGWLRQIMTNRDIKQIIIGWLSALSLILHFELRDQDIRKDVSQTAVGDGFTSTMFSAIILLLLDDQLNESSFSEMFKFRAQSFVCQHTPFETFFFTNKIVLSGTRWNKGIRHVRVEKKKKTYLFINF